LAGPEAEALGEGTPFSAVFAANDSMARGVVDELEEDLIRVPEDVSVAGVNDDPYSLGRKRLTTVRQPLAETGETAATMLLERINGYAGAPRTRLLPGRVVEGQTTAPPGSGQRRRRFTLIKLLVVIGIIAILTSMLLPALSNAKESAKRVACVNEVKEIGMACFPFASDYEERLPCGAQKPTST